MRSLGRAGPGNENANVNNSTEINRAMTCMAPRYQPTCATISETAGKVPSASDQTFARCSASCLGEGIQRQQPCPIQSSIAAEPSRAAMTGPTKAGQSSWPPLAWQSLQPLCRTGRIPSMRLIDLSRARRLFVNSATGRNARPNSSGWMGTRPGSDSARSQSIGVRKRSRSRAILAQPQLILDSWRGI
jgi:hypothetical protein